MSRRWEVFVGIEEVEKRIIARAEILDRLIRFDVRRTDTKLEKGIRYPEQDVKSCGYCLPEGDAYKSSIWKNRYLQQQHDAPD
jgi:hypothetical protein